MLPLVLLYECNYDCQPHMGRNYVQNGLSGCCERNTTFEFELVTSLP